MLETVDARTTLARAPRGLSAWDFRRSASGALSWTCPREHTPDGLSLVQVFEPPDKQHRLRVEGNLTACRYGKRAAVGSLDGEDLGAAVQDFLSRAEDTLGAKLPEPDAWDLHRLDPSRTLALPEGVEPSAAVEVAAQAWGIQANARQVVSRHNAGTVTYRRSQWRSWSAYDKTTEAGSRGIDCRAGLLRVEARIRPRRGSGLWKHLAPTLALTEEDREMAANELDLMLHTLAVQAGATGQLGIVRSLMRGGATPSQAFRLASFTAIREVYGQDVLDGVGIAERTAARWRAEAKKFYEAGGGDSAHDEDGRNMLVDLAPHLARHLLEAEDRQGQAS